MMQGVSPLAYFPIGFALCAALHAVARKMFPKWGLLDFPERYGISRARLPYPTGILAVLTFLLVFPLIFEPNAQILGIIAAVSALAIVSFMDDRTPLPPVPRFAMQFAIAGILFWTGHCTGGRICSVTNPFEGFIGGDIVELNGDWPILSFIITTVWLLLTVNALNWFDGIPGQVSALSVVGFLTIGYLALFRLGESDTGAIALLLAGIALGCLLFDFPPAKVIMGDTGAMFFGLLLGILTIYSGGKVATAFLVLGVPIVDSVIVTIRRISKGKSPLKGGDGGEHLHHRLLAKGWSPHAVIGLSVVLGSLFGITALFLDTKGKMIAGVLLVCVMLGLSWYSRPAKP